jgi:hypothetical protein
MAEYFERCSVDEKDNDIESGGRQRFENME